MASRDKQRPVSTAEARILLAEIPFVRLRRGLPTDLLSGKAIYSDTVAATQGGFAEPELVVDCASLQMSCQGVEIELSPLQFAIYAWIAQRRMMRANDAGAIHWSTLEPEGILTIYARLPGITAAKAQAQRERWTSGVPADALEQNKSKINAAFRRRLGAQSAPYEVRQRGPIPGTQYETIGLSLDPDHIRFESIISSDDGGEGAA